VIAALENALHGWLQTASSLAGGQVIFSDQGGDAGGAAPAGTYLAVRLGDSRPLGAVDAVYQDYDAGRALAQEVGFTAIGQRELTIAIQAYSELATGDSSARAVLETVQTALSLTPVRDALAAANVSPVGLGAIRNLSALRDGGSNFEGRAILEVPFYAVNIAQAFTSYIETVNITATWHPPA
jgi:hypothetical protein